MLSRIIGVPVMFLCHTVYLSVNDNCRRGVTNGLAHGLHHLPVTSYSHQHSWRVHVPAPTYIAVCSNQALGSCAVLPQGFHCCCCYSVLHWHYSQAVRPAGGHPTFLIQGHLSRPVILQGPAPYLSTDPLRLACQPVHNFRGFVADARRSDPLVSKPAQWLSHLPLAQQPPVRAPRMTKRLENSPVKYVIKQFNK